MWNPAVIYYVQRSYLSSFYSNSFRQKERFCVGKAKAMNGTVLKGRSLASITALISRKSLVSPIHTDLTVTDTKSTKNSNKRIFLERCSDSPLRGGFECISLSGLNLQLTCQVLENLLTFPFIKHQNRYTTTSA